jgi:dimethylargininase
LTKEEFLNFNILEIPEEESYAANCIWINDKVILPKGYPIAGEIIKNAGYQIVEVDVSEFQKLDGGLSCLSLRF